MLLDSSSMTCRRAGCDDSLHLCFPYGRRRFDCGLGIHIDGIECFKIRGVRTGVSTGFGASFRVVQTLANADGFDEADKDVDPGRFGVNGVEIPDRLDELLVRKISSHFALHGSNQDDMNKPRLMWMTLLIIPPTVVSIGDFAFVNCFNLRKVYLPNGMKHIGRRAFWNSSLRDVYLPDGVEYIDVESFSSGVNLFAHACSTTEETLRINGIMFQSF